MKESSAYGVKKEPTSPENTLVSSFPSVFSKPSTRHCSFSCSGCLVPSFHLYFQTLWFWEEHRTVDKEKDRREEKRARWEVEGGSSDKEVREPAQLPASGLLVNPCVYPLEYSILPDDASDKTHGFISKQLLDQTEPGHAHSATRGQL